MDSIFKAMLLSTIFCLATALALPSQQKRLAAPLQLDFRVEKNSTEITPEQRSSQITTKFGKDHQKRDGPVSTDLNNIQEVKYLMDLYLGTQHDKVSVVLDTGSSDLWVYGKDSDKLVGGAFDPLASSADQDLGKSFSISYLDGSKSSGDFHKDALSFSADNSLLKDFQFAVVKLASANRNGVLGVGQKTAESVGFLGHYYDNLPWALANNGVIPKASYSLYLNSIDDSTGAIIFGGIDEAKYSGTLEKYSIDGAGQNTLGLDLSSINIDGQSLTFGLFPQFILDSGTSWNILPDNVFHAAGKALNGTLKNGAYVVSCDQPTDKFMDFNFANNKISIPYANIITKGNYFGDGVKCYLGAQAGNPPFVPYILGDVFLRSAYVYYDLTDKTISIAQAKYTTDSHVVSA